jgi:hypothetical protein
MPEPLPLPQPIGFCSPPLPVNPTQAPTHYRIDVLVREIPPPSCSTAGAWQPIIPAQPVQPVLSKAVIVPSSPIHKHEQESTVVRLVSTGSLTKLSVQHHPEGGKGMESQCKHLDLKTEKAGELHLASGKKWVHVGGEMWLASAQEVQIARDGSRVILSGHVKLLTNRTAGCCQALKSDRIEVYFKDGHLDGIKEAVKMSQPEY